MRYKLTITFSASRGLSRVAVIRSRHENGSNVISPPRGRQLWFSCLLSFFSGFGPLLWIACFFAFLSWQPFGTPPANIYNLALAIALLMVIFLSGVFTFSQEVRTSIVLSGFAELIPPDCIVIRDGIHDKLSASELVVGDVVKLETGSRVPADVRVISCSNLKVDKSLLTGESDPVKLTDVRVDSKVPMLDSPNMAFMGCNVVEGEGVGLVLATGAKNQLSKIALQVTNVKTLTTSLQRDINRFVKVVGTIALLTVVAVVLVWVWYLRVQHPNFMNTSALIANAISVIVAFVPEGLPLALSMGLSIIASRLCFTHHVLLKQLGTVETLGSMSLLASDKTGTLTQNKMTVTGAITMDAVYGDNELGSIPIGLSRALLRVSVLCNQAELQHVQMPTSSTLPEHQPLPPGASPSLERVERVVVGGNGIDKALLQFAESQGAVGSLLSTHLVRARLPFSSETKLTAAVVRGPHIVQDHLDPEIKCDDVDMVLVKGSPEHVLTRCTLVMTGHGDICPLRPLLRDEIRGKIEDVSATGRRVVALAQSLELDHASDAADVYVTDPVPNFPLEGLVFLAAVAVSDPPRDGVREAVTELRGAGIKVAMVTGDAASTAVAIAREVGIIDEPNRIDVFRDFHRRAVEGPDSGTYSKDIERGSQTKKLAQAGTVRQGEEVKDVECPADDRSPLSSAVVVEGRDLEAVYPAGWDFIFQHNEVVFARTSPEQKLQIVKESQARGFRVGVTGDGVNDSPALRRADVGIAMNSGSDVAHDAASVVLLEDDFRSIVHGVREGRTIFNNLRKVIAYQLAAGSWAELLPVLATFFLGMPQPLSSFLMIIISCVTDVFAGVALTNELPEKLIMSVPPRDPVRSPLVCVRLMCYSYLFYGTLESIGAFTSYFWYMSSRGPIGEAGSRERYPIGYMPSQLIGAWHWEADPHSALGRDQSAASATASSVFFVTLVVSQMGHLLSIRRKTPYFSDAIINTDAMTGQGQVDSRGVWTRIGLEIAVSRPLPAVLLAWGGAVIAASLFTEVPSIQSACGTAHVPAKFWGLAFGWSACWFALGEIRKWIILSHPNSILSKTAW